MATTALTFLGLDASLVAGQEIPLRRHAQQSFSFNVIVSAFGDASAFLSALSVVF